MRMIERVVFGGLLACAGMAYAAAPKETPRPLPLTRPELKRLIESVKVRTPRIPLPELTDAERQKLGTQADSYESRLRYHYMPGIDDGRSFSNRGQGGRGDGNRGEGATRTAGFGQQQNEPGMTLDNAFKVELFWIVSRINNCQYCLGHQESKLLAAGVSEDQIAALDCDWSRFTPAEQAAFAFARKYTFEPHLLSDADIAGLKKHYTDMQILEMMLSMAGNNSINRWKEGVGVPQRKDEGGYSRVGRADPNAPLDANADPKLPRGTYLTPTSPEFENKISKILPILGDVQSGQTTAKTVFNRPALESREKVEQKLAQARTRKARLPLVDKDKTRELLRDYVVHVTIDPDKQTALGVTVDAVMQTLQSQGLQPAEPKTAEKGQPTVIAVPVRAPESLDTLGKLKSIGDLESQVITKTAGGQEIRLKDVARVELGVKDAQENAVSAFAQLMANYPRSGIARVKSVRSSDEKGDLSPVVKAQLSWIVARQDRAWYAVGEARSRLRKAGQSDDQIFALDGDWKSFTPREQALFTVARNLAASPVVLTDVEVAKAVELAGPRDVVQAISYTTQRASFDRLTEAAGLPLDE